MFNNYIRLRDEAKGCISCSSMKVEHASHFYAAGSYSGLRFNELNVHGSCIRCNTFLHGNIHEYRKRLLDRIGMEKLTALDLYSSLNRYKKYSRSELEFIILQYGKMAANQGF